MPVERVKVSVAVCAQLDEAHEELGKRTPAYHPSRILGMGGVLVAGDRKVC
jgi:hypothetical protein